MGPAHREILLKDEFCRTFDSMFSMFTSSRKGAGGPSNLCDEMEHMHRTNFGEYFLDDDGGGIEDDSDAESDDDRLIAPMSDPPGDSGQPPQAHIRYDPPDTATHLQRRLVQPLAAYSG